VRRAARRQDLHLRIQGGSNNRAICRGHGLHEVTHPCGGGLDSLSAHGRRSVHERVDVAGEVRMGAERTERHGRAYGDPPIAHLDPA